MSSKKRTENLSDISHEQILGNKEADTISRVATYYDYIAIGYSKQEAMQMAGLKKIPNE